MQYFAHNASVAIIRSSCHTTKACTVTVSAIRTTGLLVHLPIDM